MVSIEKLSDYIKKFDSVAIAFSGGVDSTLIAKTAYMALKDRAVAITARAPYVAQEEIADSIKLAQQIGIRQVFVDVAIVDSIKNNPIDRCYFCKKNIFDLIIKEAKNQGIKNIIDGTNFDDVKEYRPGLKALEELKILSPLKELKFTKNDVRKLSKELNLETFDKPAYSCLLTRIPHNEEITEEKIKKVERAEQFLHENGIYSVRVRNHGEIAVIEIDRSSRAKLFNENLLDRIDFAFKEIGFRYVTMNIYGYKSGNLTLKK